MIKQLALPDMNRLSSSAWFMWVVGGIIALVSGSIMALAMSKTVMLGLAFVIGALGGLLVFKWPAIGMGVLTFLIPLERFQRFTDDTSEFTISIMRIAALGTLGALMLHRVLKKEKIQLDYTMILYGLYVCFALGGLFHSSDPGGTKRAIGTIGANVIFFFLYLNYFRTRKQIHAMLAIWLASNFVAIVYSAADWHFGSGRGEGIEMEIDPGQGAQTTENRWATVWRDRAEFEKLGVGAIRRSMGPTSHAAVYGINLIMAMPFFVLLFQRYQNRVWLGGAFLAILGLLAYNVMLTNTRAVMLQAGICAVLCVVAGLYRLKTVHILLGIIALSVGLALMPKDVFKRVLDPTNYSVDQSQAMQVRFEYWKAGVSIIEKKWLVGMGVGNEKEIPKYVKGDLSANKSTVHNTYLQFLLEVGIFGWLIFYGFVATMFLYANRAAKYFKRIPGWELEYRILLAIQVAFTCVLIFGLQVDVFLFPLKSWWLIAMVGLVLYRWSRLPPENLRYR